MPEVFILNFGTTLGKKSGRLLIKEQGKVVEEIPFRDISALTIATRGADNAQHSGWNSVLGHRSDYRVLGF